MNTPLRKISPETEVGQVLPLRKTPTIPLSMVLWGLDFKKHFPVQLDEEIVAEVATFEEIQAFASKNFNKLYGIDFKQSPFLQFDNPELRKRYYEAAGDLMVIRLKGELVGVFVGNAIDWSTYYIRNITILGEHHGKRICQKFLLYLVDILSQYQIDRVEADAAPSSLPNVHILNKLKFRVTGQTLSERWGVLTRFTRILSARHDQTFKHQFCCGLSPDDKKA